MKKTYSMALTAALLAVATATARADDVPPKTDIETQTAQWHEYGQKIIDDGLKKRKQAFDQAVDECNGKNLHLPTINFNNPVTLNGVNEFYPCIQQAYPSLAAAAGVDPVLENFDLQLLYFQKTQWLQVIENSLTPAQASQNMMVYYEQLRHDIKIEDQIP